MPFYVVDLYRTLVDNNIGTTSIESLSNRLSSGQRKGRKDALVSMVIKWKFMDANNELMKARYENTKIWRESK